MSKIKKMYFKLDTLPICIGEWCTHVPVQHISNTGTHS